MRLGIDFGTTRTVVAFADRGNYPVVGFQTESGDAQLWNPTLIASHEGVCKFGLDAQNRVGDSGWAFLRSLKRLLSQAGPETVVQIGSYSASVLDLLTSYLSQLRTDLLEKSNLDVRTDEPFEAWIAVPANANSNQRFLTLEGFRRAGFQVLGMLNEPSAAGIEYAQRYKGLSGRREYLVVYDLGGGTFDVSIISATDRSQETLGNEGISRLGGDDFDEILMNLVERLLPKETEEISDAARYSLLEECRLQKEALHPNTRKLVIDLSSILEEGGEIIIPVSEFYAECSPLVDRTMEALESAIVRCKKDHGIGWDEVASLYLVGGSSDLPVVARKLRELYGRRVRRSPYPYAATAIGLAIVADQEDGYSLRERFTRYFGVWREAENGSRIILDPIFEKGTQLPTPGEPPLQQTRSYFPVHNIGHYRYIECGGITDDGQPGGDLMPWDDILFPLDPRLQDQGRLESFEVKRMVDSQPQAVEEIYTCDETGTIRVTLRNVSAGYERSYRLRNFLAR